MFVGWSCCFFPDILVLSAMFMIHDTVTFESPLASMQIKSMLLSKKAGSKTLSRQETPYSVARSMTKRCQVDSRGSVGEDFSVEDGVQDLLDRFSVEAAVQDLFGRQFEKGAYKRSPRKISYTSNTAILSDCGRVRNPYMGLVCSSHKNP